MDNYLGKRFLADIQYEKCTNKTIKRSVSAESLLECAPVQELNKNLPNIQERFKISTDILKFRQNAINTCKHLLHTFSTEIVPFFNTTHEATQFIHSLEASWVNNWKANISFLDHELKTLKNMYVNENEDFDKFVGSIDELTYSDEDIYTISASKTKEMMASLERPNNKKTPNRLTLKHRLNTELHSKSDTSSEFHDINMLRGTLDDVKENTENEDSNTVPIDKTINANKSMDMGPLKEIPDCASLSSVNISLNLSSIGSLVFPNANSEENTYTISKHYVATKECDVIISWKEKLAVDDIRKNYDLSESEETSDSINLAPTRKGRKRKLILSSSSSSSQTSEDSSNADYFTDRISEASYEVSHENNAATNSQSADPYDYALNVLDEIPDYEDYDNLSISNCSTSIIQTTKIKDNKDIKEKIPKAKAPDEERNIEEVDDDTRSRQTTDPLLKRERFLVSSDSGDSDIDKYFLQSPDENDEPQSSKSNKFSLGKRKPSKSLHEDDSDVEFISSERDEGASRKKGRRNIHSILSEKELNVETLAVPAVERERLERLGEKSSQIVLSQKSNSPTDDFILNQNEDTPIKVPARLAAKLFNHQRRGVQFLWDNCYESVARLKQGDEGAGCILAHCMGVGKTLQVVTLSYTLFKHPITNTRRILVICELSSNWRNEFRDAGTLCGDQHVHIYQHRSKKLNVIQTWYETGGVLLMNCESFVANVNGNERIKELLFKPDLVVCDEGHLLKCDKAQRTQAISQIKTKRRIVLTGTPMQNNLNEYYFMVEFVKPNFLGTIDEYHNRFVNPITNGQFENSTQADIKRMKQRSHVLHKMTLHFIQRYEASELSTYLPTKYDYAIKIQMTELQITLLKKFLGLCDVNRLFANVAVIRAICTHPYILEMQRALRNQNELLEMFSGIPLDWFVDHLPADAATNINYGAKLMAMMAIINEVVAHGEKLIIFSCSLKTLDLIEKFLQAVGQNWIIGQTYYRIDHKVPVWMRIKYCNKFNQPMSRSKLMLLTKVGGLGLNLHAANRAIIMDTSWNPADDTQSVFRIYRIGQNKTCYIYRLIAMGTTEEVIYERSVTKQAISGRVVDEMQIGRDFNASEILAMYRCNLDNIRKRPMSKLPQDAVLASLLQKHNYVYSYQEHNELLQNVPDEELNEAEIKLAWEEYEKEKDLMWPVVVAGPSASNDLNLTGMARIRSPGYNPDYPSILAGETAEETMNKWRKATLDVAADLTHLRNKVIQFISPNIFGGKEIVRYDIYGKVRNVKSDNLTPNQVKTAESLVTDRIELPSKKYYILPDGALRPEGSSSIPLSWTKPSKSKPNPADTTDIMVIDDDDDDLELIE